METLGILALVVQVLTEAVSRLYPKGTVYVATVVGVLVAVLTETGLLASLDVPVKYAVVDWVLAGVALAGGAGVVQALKQKLKG